MNKRTKSVKKEFINIRKLYVSMMSLYELADKIFGSIYVAFMRSQNLTIAQISKLFSLEQILLAVFDYPTGTISDKFGRKKIASFGFIVWGIGILEFAFASSFLMFLPAMVLMALGLALISGAPSAWLIDQMISHGVYEERNQIFPKIQSCIQFFAVIASVIAYFLIDIGNQLPIIVAGSISIIAGIYGLVTGKDNYGNVKGDNIFSTLYIHSLEFIKEKKLILLALRTVINYMPFAIFVLYWQIYATEIINFESKYLPFMLIIFMVLFMLGNYFVSVFSKKISSFMTSILGITIGILGFLIIFTCYNVLSFIFAASLIEFGFGVERVATSTWMCDYIKGETRATYSSIFSTVQAVGGFIFINILGIIIDLIGLNIAWIVAIMAMCFDIAILLLFSSKYKYDNVK